MSHDPASHRPEKLRLALATTELAVGGAERCLVNLAIGLDRARFEPVVYSLAPPPAPQRAELVRQLEAAGVPVHFIGTPKSWQFSLAVRRMARLLAEQAPHVLQTFLFHANTVGVLAGHRAGVPQVITGIRVSDPRRWRHWLERRLSKRVHRIVCVSESVAEFSRTRGGLSTEKIVVIPNGLDVAAYDAAAPADLSPLGILAERSLIACVGRLDRQKGIDWLLQLAPRFLAELPDHDLLIVGDGPDRSALESQAKHIEPRGRIFFAGWQADVPAILRRSALLVLPSRWEGMPNVLLEAMAARLPVVATRVEGVAEILGPIAAEQAVAPGDDAAFVRQVVALARPGNGRGAELGLENHRRVAEHFSSEAMIRAYAALYEECVSRGT